MEWLDFKPWSAEVTQKLSAVAIHHSPETEKAGDVLPFRAPRASTQDWARLIQDWPRDSLWGHWVDVEN